MNINVAFSDADESRVVASFTSEEPNTDSWPYQGVVENTDPRWVEYMSAFPDEVKASFDVGSPQGE